MLEQRLNDFLTELKIKGSSKYTIKNYRGSLKKYTRQIKYFRNTLVDNGLKPGTINLALAALKSFQLLQEGVPIDKVQDVLGHVDISTTRRYAKTAPEAILELAAKVDTIKENIAVYRYYLGN